METAEKQTERVQTVRIRRGAIICGGYSECLRTKKKESNTRPDLSGNTRRCMTLGIPKCIALALFDGEEMGRKNITATHKGPKRITKLVP